MRSEVFGALLCAAWTGLGAGLVTAQKKASPDLLKERFAAMQAEEWFEGGGWTADFEAAKATAASKGRVILAYFTRSYAP